MPLTLCVISNAVIEEFYPLRLEYYEKRKVNYCGNYVVFSLYAVPINI